MIIFDHYKAEKLRKERGIDLDEVALLISERMYLDILQNKSRPGQMVFVLEYNGYMHAVPFVADNKGNYIIKTAYKSRVLQKRYGGNK